METLRGVALPLGGLLRRGGPRPLPFEAVGSTEFDGAERVLRSLTQFVQPVLRELFTQVRSSAVPA